AADRFVGPGARGVDLRVRMERRRNPERVPRARREPRSTVCVDSKPIRYRRKRRRRPQIHRAGPKNDDVAFGKRTERRIDPRLRKGAGVGDVARRRGNAVFDDRFVNRFANRPQLVVRRHRTTYAIVTPLMRMLLATLVAMLMLGSFAEAAFAGTGVRHRPRHSSRVSAGTTEPAPATKK